MCALPQGRRWNPVSRRRLSQAHVVRSQRFERRLHIVRRPRLRAAVVLAVAGRRRVVVAQRDVLQLAGPVLIGLHFGIVARVRVVHLCGIPKQNIRKRWPLERIAKALPICVGVVIIFPISGVQLMP